MPQFTGGNYYDIMYYTQSVVKVGVISWRVYFDRLKIYDLVGLRCRSIKRPL